VRAPALGWPARDGPAAREDRPTPARPAARPGSGGTGTCAPGARTRRAACPCRSSGAAGSWSGPGKPSRGARS
jgi:hypothetical protein